MDSNSKVSYYVVHYSKLVDRKKTLESLLNGKGIPADWVTEHNFFEFKTETPKKRKIVGVNEKLAGMDFGINSRSIIYSRKKARLQGYYLFLRSYFSKNNKFSTGSLPSRDKLSPKWLELQRMHLTALKLGIIQNRDWILVLEDDAIPIENAFSILHNISHDMHAKNCWINLSSGAGLKRTSSDLSPDKNGLFRVKPATTRCAVAYLVSKDLAEKIVSSAIDIGVPDWLPIDFYFQILLRKFKATSYWQEPVTFIQGSESGEYLSGFNEYR